MSDYRQIAVFLMFTITPALFLSKMANHTPKETALNVLGSAVPASAIITAASGYSFGFICHAKTTEAGINALKKNDYRSLENARKTNKTCFSTARLITGV